MRVLWSGSPKAARVRGQVAREQPYLESVDLLAESAHGVEFLDRNAPGLGEAQLSRSIQLRADDTVGKSKNRVSSSSNTARSEQAIANTFETMFEFGANVLVHDLGDHDAKRGAIRRRRVRVVVRVLGSLQQLNAWRVAEAECQVNLPTVGREMKGKR